MAENTLPKKNVAFTFYTSLVDSGSRPDLRASATLAAGDVQVSTDGGAFANLGTLPVVTPAAGVAIKVDLSAAEMNGDNVTVKFIDAAGGEWDDQLIEIRPATRKVEDLAWPTTTGRSLDVAATGEAGLDFGNATGSITGGELGVGAFASAAITADAIAADAVGASELATDAVNEIRDSIISDATTFQGADIAAILADTLSLDGTKIPDVISLANINAEVDTGLTDINLDHLIFSAVDTDFITTVDPDSVVGWLAHDGTGTGTGGGGFDRESESLEALRDNMGTSVGADLSADIAAVKAETALIVADTNELQTDWVDAGRLDAILDNILTDTGTTLDDHLTDIKGTSFVKDTHSLIDLKTETALIVADTNELQTDWADGGRLDQIIDDILIDTAVIGALGAGLTNIPWNSSWDTEVESECNDALVALNLDHLVLNAVDTDWETTVHLDSVVGHMTSDGTGTGTGTGADDGFDRTFHSLEILRNWITDVLNTNAIILPGQEAPTLSPTTTEAIGWLYKMMRNRKDQTATLFQLYADDESTVDAKATVSDDATTAIVQELVTGP